MAVLTKIGDVGSVQLASFCKAFCMRLDLQAHARAQQVFEKQALQLSRVTHQINTQQTLWAPLVSDGVK